MHDQQNIKYQISVQQPIQKFKHHQLITQDTTSNSGSTSGT